MLTLERFKIGFSLADQAKGKLFSISGVRMVHTSMEGQGAKNNVKR